MDATLDAGFPQLALLIVNQGSGTRATNVAYITTDAGYNKIDLKVSINTGTTTLTPGTIVDPGDTPGEGTVLYLDMSGLSLSGPRFNQLRLQADDWHFKLFEAQRVVGMTPARAIAVGAGASGTLVGRLTQLEIDAPPSMPSVQLSVTYYNVPGITDGTAQYAFFAVALQKPPDSTAGNLAEALSVSLSTATLVNSYDVARTAVNSFALNFSQGPQPAQVTADADTLFKVSFVYGKAGDPNGYGALTDVAHALKMQFSSGSNADGWVITQDTSQESPSWILQPPARALVDADTVVSILVDKVVTTYQPGPTVMLVAYQHVPGYQDGTYTLVLTKLPHVVIDSLTVDPNPTYFQNKQATVTVRWRARYATSLALMQNSQTQPVAAAGEIPATLHDALTHFTLVASGQQAVAPNTDTVSTTALALPVINSFTGAPTEIYAEGGAHDAGFAWAVDTPYDVTLSSTAESFSGQSFDPNGRTSLTIHQPQVITLQPNSQQSSIPRRRNLVISAFTPSVQRYSWTPPRLAPFPWPIGVAASPFAPFVALTHTVEDQVIILDTVAYSPLTTVKVGSYPIDVTFSRDGRLMVTANIGDKTLSLVQVTLVGGLPSFVALPAISLPGMPQQIAITPDNSRIYVSVDLGAGKIGELVALRASGGTYSVAHQVPVGTEPRGLAIEPSGARIFVANSGDNTVSIIGVDADGVPIATDVIRSVDGSPNGITITPDGRQLLVVCSDAGTVLSIDPNYPNTGTRQTLTVGHRPTQITITPSGAYAFVTNQVSGSLSLLSCWGSPADSSVLQVSIGVGNGPSGVAVSPDGLVVLVARSDFRHLALSVVMLQTYVAADPVILGGQPTDVAAAPDGQLVLAWHNALISTDLPAAGAHCYALDSRTVTSILDNVAIVQCVFAPDPAAHQVLGIGSGGPLLYVVDTSDTAKVRVHEQQLSGVGQPLALAISGDGQRLFVVLGDHTQYTLLVLNSSNGAWSEVQNMPLYNGHRLGQVRLQATADASRVFITDRGNDAFTVVSRDVTAHQYEVPGTTIQIADPASLAILPYVSKAYVLGGGTPNTITVIDVDGATLRAETVSLGQSQMRLQHLVAAPDGRRLYATDLSAGTVRILDPTSLRILQTLPLSRDVSLARGATGVTITPDASRIFVANVESGTMSILQQVQMT